MEITPTLVFVRLNPTEVNESNKDEPERSFNGWQYDEIQMDVNEYLDYINNGGDFSEFYDDLKSLINFKIAESNKLLSEFLLNNPMKSSCHGGKESYYNVTFEKQSMFTSKYTAHITLLQAGVPNDMTWNSTGNTCEVWTDEECIRFIKEMNEYVTRLVSYQQKLEIEIKNCKSIDELSKIKIDFDQFKVE